MSFQLPQLHIVQPLACNAVEVIKGRCEYEGGQKREASTGRISYKLIFGNQRVGEPRERPKKN
jgi:hypothetical protein